MNENERKWAKNLVRFAIGDVSSLDFILKNRSISPSQILLYKSICGKSLDDYKVFQVYMDSYISQSLARAIIKIMRGNALEQFNKFHKYAFLVCENPNTFSWKNFGRSNHTI
jgi:hypothetical protein